MTSGVDWVELHRAGVLTSTYEAHFPLSNDYRHNELLPVCELTAPPLNYIQNSFVKVDLGVCSFGCRLTRRKQETPTEMETQHEGRNKHHVFSSSVINMTSLRHQR